MSPRPSRPTPWQRRVGVVVLVTPTLLTLTPFLPAHAADRLPVAAAAREAGALSQGSTAAGAGSALLLQPGPYQVALTFDDGPSADYTGQILDILERYDVRATFFVTGRVAAQHPDLLRRMIEAGHSVQNHTHSHPVLTEVSDATITDQIQRANAVITAATGYRPHCLRPPFGEVSPRVRATAQALGLATVLWNVDPRDWTRPGAKEVTARVLEHTGGGDIVILHDTAGWGTIWALPRIINGLRDGGLEFVALCSTFAPEPPKIGQHYLLQFVWPM